jgi:hypothetical protein
MLMLPWNWRSRSIVPLIPTPEACDRIVTAGFVKLAALNANEANDQPFLFHQLIQVESERANLLPQFGGGLFECKENPRLVVSRGSAHPGLRREQRLDRAGAARDQRGPAARESASRDLIGHGFQ